MRVTPPQIARLLIDPSRELRVLIGAKVEAFVRLIHTTPIEPGPPLMLAGKPWEGHPDLDPVLLQLRGGQLWIRFDLPRAVTAYQKLAGLTYTDAVGTATRDRDIFDRSLSPIPRQIIACATAHNFDTRTRAIGETELLDPIDRVAVCQAIDTLLTRLANLASTVIP